MVPAPFVLSVIGLVTAASQAMSGLVSTSAPRCEGRDHLT
jgi:hypothetical protein